MEWEEKRKKLNKLICMQDDVIILIHGEEEGSGGGVLAISQPPSLTPSHLFRDGPPRVECVMYDCSGRQ